MDKFDEETVGKLDAIVKKMEKRIGIDHIDYQSEKVVLYYVFNKGTEQEFVDHDFLRVDASCESVPCAIWEVVNAVFRKIIM